MTKTMEQEIRDNVKIFKVQKQTEREWIIDSYQKSTQLFNRYGHNTGNLMFWINLFNEQSVKAE
jgi:hypothetical protein